MSATGDDRAGDDDLDEMILEAMAGEPGRGRVARRCGVRP
jgi:hypothetical protein